MLELSFPESYNLSHTFDCGQIFRFFSDDYGKTYYGTLPDRVLKIQQKDANTLRINSNKEEDLKDKLNQFFRQKDDYLEIQKMVQIDPLMEKIVQTTNGLHLVKQDLFECSIAYLLSQCSNIPRITKNLEDLAELYGQKVQFEGKCFYLFPTREDLLDLTEQDFRELGFGYRAKYIASFIQDYPAFLHESDCFGEEFNKKLQSIPGIGQKVADCIQLFGYGDVSLFPVDTWMRKFMIKYYNKGEKLSNQKIRALGRKLFGKYAGYAQEFIFHYARCFDPLVT